ncbi:hypothetical protein HAX54_048523 [Datura stramonium]|uniref:Uncharacterized protein n=1 Tax=Datura stramonium TaxID=4076 RepID=A0ABS8WJE5_DATST|nr:hypothetical protein [Datura stramonium]
MVAKSSRRFYLDNSRRFSRPCTTRQSYPVDKGKEKEKRQTEAEEESGLTQNWKKPFARLVLSPIGSEFYASYGASQKHQKATGPLRSRPCLEKLRVRQLGSRKEEKSTRVTLTSMPNIGWTPSNNDNEDLEHRVSELEGIRVRDTLAVLKVDVRKVKTDVQLQPDLNIFDAPLLEDNAFEDERANTDEEELEEEHMSKEIDEERQVEVAIQRSMDDVTARMVGAGQVPMLQQERMRHPQRPLP